MLAFSTCFSKEVSAADELVGRSILYKWPVVGWCVGQIVARNQDARSFKKMDGEKVMVNFHIFYEMDQLTAKTVLRLNEYNGDEDDSGCC